MATTTATVINLLNTVLGAGMLALPYAFKEQGVLLATLSLLFGALAVGIGLMIQVYSSGFLPPGTASFFQVSKLTNPSLAVLFDIAILLKCFGVSVSYLVIIADLMPMVTDYFNHETSRLIWLIVAMVIVTPISFQHSLESLKTASLIALSSVVYLVIIVVGHFLWGDMIEEKGPVSWLRPDGISGIVQTMPIIVFAYTCAQNMYSSINEISEKTVKNLFGVVLTCMSASFLIYYIVGLSGYLTFGSSVTDNIISVYPQSVWSTFGRFAIVVLVVFSYPLMLHPARASLSNVLRAWRVHSGATPPGESDQLLGAPATHNVAAANKEHILITTALLVLSFVLATTLKSLGLVLSFVGATGATAVSFILPGIFGYTLSSSDRENALVHLTPAQKSMVKVISALLFLWGIVVAVLAVGLNIAQIVSS